MAKRQMDCRRSINVHLNRLHEIQLIIEAHILSGHGIIVANLDGSDIGPRRPRDGAMRRGKTSQHG